MRIGRYANPKPEDLPEYVASRGFRELTPRLAASCQLSLDAFA
ncbi:hypothetical protein HMPREF0454_03255 [Hafnia alvei ATCC 51873]|uniref:Uncharacterized protein n=1 Tax=Hafnia alvei ATCC 51873 TaxID=1002364 RepID=G9Y9A4_HAFAL|nr:hypothetical protein HMPREF0454_03255 [Hafnia alvei ATCC 51873]